MTMLLKRLKPWVVMVLVVSITTFTIGAMTGGGGLWLLAGALFYGIFIALVVWRDGHTPSSAWSALRRPPREGL